MNPISVFLVLVSLAVMSVLVSGIFTPLIVCVAFVILAFVGGVGKSFVDTYYKLWIGVALLLFVLRALFIEGTHTLFTIGSIAVTREGVMNGLSFSIAVMAVSGAITLYFTLFSMKYSMLALELRGVTPRATYVLLASFQAITELSASTRVVMEAQKSRGIETEGNIFQRIRAFVPVLAPVFLSAMAATEERAIALDARAFNSRNTHSHLVSLRVIPAWEIVIVVAAVSGAALACVGTVLSWY